MPAATPAQPGAKATPLGTGQAGSSETGKSETGKSETGKSQAGKSQAGRIARVAIGLLVLAVGGAFVADRSLTLRSNAAVLGLAVIVIRAPIVGELRLAGLAQGDMVAPGVALGRIATPRQDDWRLTDLRGSLAIVEAELRAQEVLRESLVVDFH